MQHPPARRPSLRSQPLQGHLGTVIPRRGLHTTQVKNSSGEDVREGVYVSNTEEHELSGSRGTANFRLKWVKDTRHEAYMNVQQVKGVTRALTAADEHKFVPIIGFDCRGLEPIDWRPEVRPEGVSRCGCCIISFYM